MTGDRFRDLRHALRTLRRQPGFVAAVVGTFAVAIGSNAAMLGLITRLMFAPPPGIADPARVVRLSVESTERPGETARMSTFSYPMFESMREATRIFSSVAAARFDTVMVGRDASLRPSPALEVSGRYFATLGATPALGRFIVPADDQLPIGASVVVLGHAYWSRAFGRDPAVVGRELIIDGTPFIIVGVARAGFNGDNLSPVDLFMPLTAGMRSSGFGWWTVEHMNLVTIVGRLAADVSPAGASDLATTTVRARDVFATSETRKTAHLSSVVPGRSARETTQSQIAIWLAGVSIIVLLIATANVGTLLLLRAARRQRETAVRITLGAPRSHLARQLAMESLILSFAGAVAGLILSRWFGEALRVTLLPGLAPSEELVDQRVVLISMIVAAAAGLLAALSPMLQVGRRDIASALRAGGEAGASRQLTSQRILVGLQVALCTVLLIGAGLFIRSLDRVQSQNLGFSTSGILYVTLEFQGFLTGREKDLAYEDALRRVRGVTGVRAATLVEAFPFGPFHVPPMRVPGREGMPTLGGQPPFLYAATPEYLKMMKVTLRQGRLLDERDRRGSQLVVLVNESMARTIWPGEPAVGKCIRAGYPANMTEMDDPMEAVATAPCREVVGVVADSRARSLRGEGNEAKQMQYYVPFEQIPAPPSPNFSNASGLFVHVGEDAEGARSAVQRAVQSGLDRSAYVRVRAYQDLIDPQLRSWKLGASLFTLFGALALGIAAMGLFGVISYLIAQRTREIGVRIALGASRDRMWRLVVLDAVKLVAVGLVAGVLIAMAAGPLVRDMLYRTSPWEVANAATAIVVLLGVTVCAAAWPAWRAGRVDPLTALRSDG